jgi:hypothetical protein
MNHIPKFCCDPKLVSGVDIQHQDSIDVALNVCKMEVDQFSFDFGNDTRHKE